MTTSCATSSAFTTTIRKRRSERRHCNRCSNRMRRFINPIYQQWYRWGTWSSSNPAAATVNAANGLVTGVAAGNAIITYTVTTMCGTVTASAPITVNPVLNAGTISGGSSVCMGATIRLSSNGNSGGQWTSSMQGLQQ